MKTNPSLVFLGQRFINLDQIKAVSLYGSDELNIIFEDEHYYRLKGKDATAMLDYLKSIATHLPGEQPRHIPSITCAEALAMRRPNQPGI